MRSAGTLLVRLLGASTIAAALGGCMGAYYEHPAAEYVHRSDTITLSAGNAKDVNAATHVIDPWPRRVANRRIPGNGDRMVGAVERYRARPAARADAQAGPTPPGPGAAGAAPAAATPPGAAAGSTY